MPRSGRRVGRAGGLVLRWWTVIWRWLLAVNTGRWRERERAIAVALQAGAHVVRSRLDSGVPVDQPFRSESTRNRGEVLAVRAPRVRCRRDAEGPSMNAHQVVVEECEGQERAVCSCGWLGKWRLPVEFGFLLTEAYGHQDQYLEAGDREMATRLMEKVHGPNWREVVKARAAEPPSGVDDTAALQAMLDHLEGDPS